MNKFQEKMYNHLIGYKHSTLKIMEKGILKNKDYDIALPKTMTYENLYPGIKNSISEVLERDKEHIYFSHLASSQAACINLFYPILRDTEKRDLILKEINQNIHKIYDYKFEFRDIEKDYLGEGPTHGTDADVAIFYRDDQNRECLWLVEHKLTEDGFTNCNAHTSNGRQKHHRCDITKDIINNPDLCYYHDTKKYKYWELTNSKTSVYDVELLKNIEGPCPFTKSLCQLWRNQLMARELEKDKYYRVDFSVVYYEGNNCLWSIGRPVLNSKNVRDIHLNLLKDEFKDRFSTFTIQSILESVEKNASNELGNWLNWYKEKYINITE
jgi:hypothetical protein